jgi:putative ABC transport system permease protein
MAFEIGPIFRSIARQKSTFSLVVLELAAGFTVMTCLVLAGSWYLALGQRSSGFAEQDLVAVMIQAPGVPVPESAPAPTPPELERIRAVPGVAAVAPVSTELADEHWGYPSEYSVRPAAGEAPSDAVSPGWIVRSTPALFDVVSAQLAEGALPAAGAGDLSGVTVLTQCLRARLFGAGPALGRVVASEAAPPARVIGVIRDVEMVMPFLPSSACVDLRFAGAPSEREQRYLLRTAPGQRAAVVARLREALGPGGPARLVKVTALDSRASRHASIAYGLVLELGIFGATVALLALIGVLAVSSFLVSERRRQIGIRRALGGTRRDIVRYFLVEGSLAAVLGTGLGLLATLAFLGIMRSVFSELRVDWRQLAVPGVGLWLIATSAALLPARRAARIPPSVATRTTS